MMTRAILSWAGCALALCLSLTQRLPAQLPVTVPPPSARVCDQAASVVAKGRIDYGAFHTVLACETVGANAFAAGIPKLANLSDTAKLDDFMTVADNWSDATIVSAATTLANNASASAQARVCGAPPNHAPSAVVPVHLRGPRDGHRHNHAGGRVAKDH
jgi:hypothetical protein